MGKVNPLVNQTKCRGRNDDGSETTATWQAVENTAWTQASTAKFRIRYQLQEQNGGAAKNSTFDIVARKNSGAWVSVSSTGGAFVNAVPSATVANETVTTRQLTAGSGTFEAGWVVDDGITPLQTLGASNYTEHEYVVQFVEAGVAQGDVIDFRIQYGDGTLLEAYGVAFASVTVNIVAKSASGGSVAAVGVQAVGGGTGPPKDQYGTGSPVQTGEVALDTYGIGSPVETGQVTAHIYFKAVGGTVYTVGGAISAPAVGGGSTAIVSVAAVGSGVKHASGGGVASVGVAAVGVGTKSTTGSSASTVSIGTAGTGSKAVGGSGTVSASAAAVGAGTKISGGGSASNVTATSLGAGVKNTGGSSVVGVTVTPSGIGIKSTTSGSNVTVTATAVGAGFNSTPSAGAGGSVVSVVSTSTGSGTKHVSGGSSATVGASSVGAGTKRAAGSSNVTVSAGAIGVGYKGTTGSSLSPVAVTAVGAGGNDTSPSGGSAATVNVSATGEGVKHAIGGSTSTVGATTVGDGRKDTTGSSLAIIQATVVGAGVKTTSNGGVVVVEAVAIGSGFNAASLRDITIDILPVTLHTTVGESVLKTFINPVQLAIPGLRIQEVQLQDLSFGSPTIKWTFKSVTIGTTLAINETQTLFTVKDVTL